MKKFLKFFVNKYVITTTVFLVYVFIFSDNNLAKHFRLNQKIASLKKDQISLKKTQNYIPDVEVLKTQKDSLEKHARETWDMTKDNEDLFIMVYYD